LAPPVQIYLPDDPLYRIESQSHHERAKNAKERAMNETKAEIEQTAEQAVDAMLNVHRELGPGLLESTDQGRR
jgi:hypothetical protein